MDIFVGGNFAKILARPFKLSNFHNSTPISLKKIIWVLFLHRKFLQKKVVHVVWKKPENYPKAKIFHDYSNDTALWFLILGHLCITLHFVNLIKTKSLSSSLSTLAQILHLKRGWTLLIYKVRGQIESWRSRVNEVIMLCVVLIYSDDLFIRTRLLPVDISGLTSFLDYWMAHQSGGENWFAHFLSRLARFSDYRRTDLGIITVFKNYFKKLYLL